MARIIKHSVYKQSITLSTRELFLEEILLSDINLQHKVGILQFVMIF